MMVTSGIVGGLLKIHLIEAHLSHNTNEFSFERMSPFVFIRIGMQEWRSAVCFNSGRNPRWELQFMDHSVINPNEDVIIEVRD